MCVCVCGGGGGGGGGGVLVLVSEDNGDKVHCHSRPQNRRSLLAGGA